MSRGPRTTAQSEAPSPVETAPRRGRRVSARLPWFAIADGQSPALVRDRDRLYRWLLAAGDVAAAALALLLALTLLDGVAPRFTVVLVLPIVVLANKLFGLYDRDELLLRKTTLDEGPVLFQVATLYALLIWLLEDLVVVGDLTRPEVLLLWGALFAAALGSRALARRLARFLAATERLLVLGDEQSALRLREKLAQSATKAEVVEVLAPGPDGRWTMEGGDPTAWLQRVIHERQIQRVILAPGTTDTDDYLDLVRTVKSLGVRVSILPRIFEVVGSSVVFDDLHGVTLLGVRRFGLTRSSQLVKRSLDIGGALLGGILLLPLLIGIAVGIKLTSRGPVLFRQVRVGRDGQLIEMVKFRTMVVGAEAAKTKLLHLNETGGMFKMREDPRITRFGRLLRRSSLDELPQLWNVLRGDMSLVGPRPLVLDEDQRVEGWHRRRLHLTPGMTGPWQILGSVRVPLADMVVIDYLYVANWSFWNDVKILLRTVLHVLGSKGI